MRVFTVDFSQRDEDDCLPLSAAGLRPQVDEKRVLLKDYDLQVEAWIEKRRGKRVLKIDWDSVVFLSRLRAKASTYR